MIVELLILIITFGIAYFFYTHKRIKDHYRENGVKYVPGVPIFGNAFSSSVGTKHIVDDLTNVYNAFPGEKYVAYIEATQPILMIRDPEIIKTITVKDFDHFVDHRQFFPEEIEPLFGGSVLMMKGERWRHMRTTLSPAFTGSKMRKMMPFMTEISNNVVDYLKNEPLEEIDIGDLIRRYTNDVIASAGFGLQVNSFKDKTNEFFTLGQGLFKLNIWQRILFMFVGMFPEFAKKLNVTLFPKKTQKFFKDIVHTTMEQREKSGIERPDMIQLLMEASKGTLKNNAAEKDDVGFATVQEELTSQSQGKQMNWTLTELAGQVFIFFAAGFESSATVLVLGTHELALNPKVQEKLYQEIKEFKETKGELTYDNFNELKYLDCVLNETLRKWSPALIMDRICLKEYELPPPRDGGKPYKLKPGELVYNMVNTIHLDPQYYPNPHKFDPERFSDENKHKIKPFTFMPFGMGPRNCIGSRFALMELKVLLYSLVLNFKILKCAKTSEPIKLAGGDFNLNNVGGTWVTLEPRK